MIHRVIQRDRSIAIVQYGFKIAVFPPCCLNESLNHQPTEQDWNEAIEDPIDKYVCYVCIRFVPNSFMFCEDVFCPYSNLQM
ncbi:MAG: hypothetical protein AB1589_21640 [Cyanobacteriota bacterium]